jgi:FKBP-type peptidyl-prolyl cis-trans isomerase
MFLARSSRSATLMAATLLAATLMAGGVPAQTPPSAPTVLLPGGTRATDRVIGTGTEAQPGRGVTVHYKGWLYSDGVRGTQFDSSRDRGQPFGFMLGAGDVILGWDEGIAGMKVGGKRTLIIPSEAGYGARGAGADIPPGATLIFDVELLAVD